MKRRLTAALLICMMVTSMTACGGAGESQPAAPEEKASTADSNKQTETARQTSREAAPDQMGTAKQTSQEALPDQMGTAKQTSQEAAPDQTEAAQAQSGQADQGQAGSGLGSIVIYFSRVGNTEFPENMDALSSASLQKEGNTLKGNAQMMAEWIAEEAGCKAVEITTEKPYPIDYDETVDQASEEQSSSERPALKMEPLAMEDYSTVYLVFPNWWGDLPMPVYTFLEEYDLGGKKVNVFVTHEGSGFSGTIDTIRELEPDADVSEALDVRGGFVTEEKENIMQWVKENK